jgi:hypothetical protein
MRIQCEIRRAEARACKYELNGQQGRRRFEAKRGNNSVL